MVAIEIPCPLDDMRRFVIISCCKSFMPEELLDNNSVFPERPAEGGAVYVEASDKVTIEKIGEVSFAHADEVIGVVYNSKSGSTKLRWDRTSGKHGKLHGEASMRSLLNLVEAGVIREEEIRRRFPRGKPGKPRKPTVEDGAIPGLDAG